jgi:hypothetical protein
VSGAEQTQQGTLTILIEGLFTEMAKKAFKRLRLAALSPSSKPRFAALDAAPMT